MQDSDSPITLSTLWVHIHVTLVEMCFLIHVRNEPSRSLRWTDAHLSSHAKCGGHRHDQDGGAAAALLEYEEELDHKLR